MMVEHGVHAWDMAAIKPIVEEAGGRFTDWTASSDIHTPDVIVSNGKRHDEVLAILAGRETEAWAFPKKSRVDRRAGWLPAFDRPDPAADHASLPRLPHLEDVWEAIRSLRVRGAPAIGIAAAYGVVIGVRNGPSRLPEVADYFAYESADGHKTFWALEMDR